MRRRDILIAAGAACAGPLYSAVPLQFFSGKEASLIEALCDRIVPEDEDPGALKAGVLYYIDRQLAGALARFGRAYRTGIEAFSSICSDRTGQSFTALSNNEKDSFLREIESGSIKGLNPFFTMVIDHTMQGYYGSPKHGGNKDEVSWKMIGIARHMHEGGPH